jgi:DtxR family Mn-dependent transcriptional regulator
MTGEKFSNTVENYVKAIWSLQTRERPVSNSALKARLNTSAPAVSEMIQTLVKLNLVRYEPYQGVELTPAGERVALEVIRHHRLIELYLHEALDVPWDEVHEEAEQLEHAISPKIAERIAARLGQPEYDPHGAPIPGADLSVPERPGGPLLYAALGVPLRIVEVDDASPDLLRYLASLNLLPGQCVVLRERAPFDGPLHIDVGGTTHAIGQQAASAVRVLELCE